MKLFNTFCEELMESTKVLFESVHPEVHDVLLHHGFFQKPMDGTHTLYGHHSGALAMADSHGDWAIGHGSLKSGNGASDLKSHLKSANIHGKSAMAA